MNVWLRTLLVVLRAHRALRRHGALPPMTVSRVRLRALPTDIDVLRHVNNGRYASLFDLGRFDLLIRTGVLRVFDENGWYGVIASSTITFRRSIELWQRFTIETRLHGHDGKAVFMIHRAVVDGEVYAEMVSRSRFLRRTGGTVPLDEVFAALGREDDLPALEPWVTEWAVASALPSRRASAPSVWT